MASIRQTPRVAGLDDFGLTLTGLTKLKNRRVRLSLQLTGRSTSSLAHLRPKQREAQLRSALARQLQRLRRRFPQIEFVSRGARKPSWTVDAVVPARQVRELARRAEVHHVHLYTIAGRRQRLRRHDPRWFCVWGVVAVQVEGQVKGFITMEDRLVVVRAYDAKDAERRLQGGWAEYAKPYLNPQGYLVRWQLVDVRNVYELFDDVINPDGTEVYSRLRSARIRPEHVWRPRRRLKRALSSR